MCGGSAANTDLRRLRTWRYELLFVPRSLATKPERYFLSGDRRERECRYQPARPRMLPGRPVRCLVLVTADAERSMNTCLGVSETLDPGDINAEALATDPRYRLYRGLPVVVRVGDAQPRHMPGRLPRSEGVRTSMTLSDPAMVEFFRDSLTTQCSATACINSSAMKRKHWRGPARTESTSPLNELLRHSAMREHYARQRRMPRRHELRTPAAGAGIPRELRRIRPGPATSTPAPVCTSSTQRRFAAEAAARFANYAAAQLVTRYGARLGACRRLQRLYGTSSRA